MTRYEKLSLGLSILAMTGTIALAMLALPIIQDRYFGGSLQYWGKILYQGRQPSALHLYIENVGRQRVNTVSINLAKIDEDVDLRTTRDDVILVPLSDFTFNRSRDFVNITSQRPLSPGQTLQVIVKGIHAAGDLELLRGVRCDVQSDFGDAVQLEPFYTLDDYNAGRGR